MSEHGRRRAPWAAVAFVAVTACGGGDANPTVGEFAGAFAGPKEAGLVEARLPVAETDGYASAESYGSPLEPSAIVQVYGSIAPRGAQPAALAGSYGGESLYLWGEGYALSGYLEHDESTEGGVEGRYFSSRGPGLFTLQPPGDAPVTAVCGRYIETGGAERGVWTLAIGSSGRVSGSVVSSTTFGDGRRVAGRLAGSRLELEEEESSRVPALAATGSFAPATGVAQGDWTVGLRTGSWEASAGGCRTLDAPPD